MKSLKGIGAHIAEIGYRLTAYFEQVDWREFRWDVYGWLGAYLVLFWFAYPFIFPLWLWLRE